MKPKASSAAKTKRDRRNSATRNIAHEGACSECTTNCQLLHRDRADPLSSVWRFFKIMLGKDFSEVMFVPSSEVHEHKWNKHINKEACLEDTLGEKYPVKISEFDNAIAFKEGWRRFSSEHHLKEGDFVVFNQVRYVGKLHFIVHIFGKSGVEKVYFQRGYNKNVPTMNKNAVLVTETLKADVMISGNKQSPSPSVAPEPIRTEHHDPTTPKNPVVGYTNGKLSQLDPVSWDMEPYMLDRDSQCIDDRTCLYDLSSFERQDRPAVAIVNTSKVESVTMNRGEKIIDSQMDSDLLNTLPVKRKFSSAEQQPNKKQNAKIENTVEFAPVNVLPAMEMAVNGGERSCTYIPKMMADNDVPVQRDVSVSKTPSFKANLDIKKKIDMSGPMSSAKDIRQKVSTCGTTESAMVNGAPEMNKAVNNGERSSTRVEKIIKCRDGSGPADNIPVRRDIPILKAPSDMARRNNRKSNDRSVPTIAAQDKREKVAPGGPIRTVKKEPDTGDGPFHIQCPSVKKQTTIPENARRSSLNGKKEVKIPKTEPIWLENISTSSGLRENSTAVVDDKPYLILESQLPSVLLPRQKVRIIYLRAPDRKLFPVTYHQKNSVRILACGWQLFKSEYHLHAGDKCHIELEDGSKRIYSLEILSRALSRVSR